MIYYGCPKCQAAMSSPESLAGQTETCLECGNVTVIPSSPVTPVAASLQEGFDSGILSEDKKPQEPERILWSGMPSHWQYMGSYVFSALLMLASVITGIGGAIGVTAMILISSLILLFCILDRIGTRYCVTTHKVTTHRGILSRDINEIPIGPIRQILLKQGIIDRMVDIGTLGFSTSASSEIEVVFRGIHEPLKVKKIVQSHSEN